MNKLNQKNCFLYVIKNAYVWSADQEHQSMDLLIKDGRLLQMKKQFKNTGSIT